VEKTLVLSASHDAQLPPPVPRCTRAARLPAETVASLAGWDMGKPDESQMIITGAGLRNTRILAEDIAKVEYPVLILSHL